MDSFDDYLLTCVFTHILPLQDIIRIRRVCIRWKNILSSCSYSYYSSTSSPSLSSSSSSHSSSTLSSSYSYTPPPSSSLRHIRLEKEDLHCANHAVCIHTHLHNAYIYSCASHLHFHIHSSQLRMQFIIRTQHTYHSHIHTSMQ